MKYYFETEYSKMCHTKDHFIEIMKEEGLSEIQVFNAERTIIQGESWCKHYGCIVERGDCGKVCKEYSPRNWVNGICSHKGNLYYPGNKTTLKL